MMPAKQNCIRSARAMAAAQARVAVIPCQAALAFVPAKADIPPTEILPRRPPPMARLNINGKNVEVNVPATTPLLWAIREQAGLTGTKYGCGIAACGACTVHLDGAAVRSSVLPVSVAEGKKITTIEGLATG